MCASPCSYNSNCIVGSIITWGRPVLLPAIVSVITWGRPVLLSALYIAFHCHMGQANTAPCNCAVYTKRGTVGTGTGAVCMGQTHYIWDRHSMYGIGTVHMGQVWW